MAKRLPVLLVVAMAVGLLAACDPVPTPPTFTVTTTADGLDANPGDGICEVTPGAGNCSLRAAFAEANAAGDARLVVPGGSYGLTVADPGDGHSDLDVTGKVSVNQGIIRNVQVQSSTGPVLDVAASGSLTSGRWTLLSSGGATNTVRIAGVANLSSTAIWSNSGGPTATAAVVEAGGSLLLTNSSVEGWIGSPAIDNDGTVLLAYSAVRGLAGPAIDTAPGAATTMVASTAAQWTYFIRAFQEDPSAAACVGSPPTSNGYNRVPNTSCSLDGPGDQQAAGSTWVDIIPPGAAECGGAVAADATGNVRPADGNGDGVAACDAGPAEAGWIPSVITLNPANATQGRCYYGHLSAGLNSYAETWTVTGLPAGLHLDDDRIVGAPTETGTFELAITVRAPEGGGQTTKTLTVAPGEEPWDLCS